VGFGAFGVRKCLKCRYRNLVDRSRKQQDGVLRRQAHMQRLQRGGEHRPSGQWFRPPANRRRLGEALVAVTLRNSHTFSNLQKVLALSAVLAYPMAHRNLSTLCARLLPNTREEPRKAAPVKNYLPLILVFSGLIGMSCSLGADAPIATETSPSTKNLPTGESCEDPAYPLECMAKVCAEYGCGESDSPLDENGCYRRMCSSDADCESQTRCRFIWQSLGFPTVDSDTGECVLTSPAMARVDGWCVPSTSSPAEPNCKMPESAAECLRALCQIADCGLGRSNMDEFGCLRPSCVDDTDCDAETQCVTLEHLSFSCGEIHPSTGECLCHEGDEVVVEKVCVPR